jgi:hypothetical protein
MTPVGAPTRPADCLGTGSFHRGERRRRHLAAWARNHAFASADAIVNQASERGRRDRDRSRRDDIQNARI